jgi:NADPH-dependent 2,4-dienoyl-CoA reductase/sulfur reductase-like enzyme
MTGTDTDTGAETETDTDPFVVVGGDAAGLSAASKCRREDPDREVVVFERGRWVSYAHCGTPYYVKGSVPALTDLLSLSPAEVAERGVDLRRGHEVIGVDTDRAVVEVRVVEHVTRQEGEPEPDHAVGETFEQPYGDLLVGTGARAREAFDRDLVGSFTLHGLDDAAAMRAFLTAPESFDAAAVDGSYVDRERVRAYGKRHPPASAAVVGGGYVGVEIAEALAANDLEVHLYQRGEHLLVPFGEAVGERVERHLREQGVTVHTGVSVDRLSGDGRVERVECDGRRRSVNMAVVGVGVEPNVEVVTDTPVELGASGAIATDEYGRTSVEGVYAAGDCAEAPHAVTGEPAWVPLGLTANRAGRAVGATVAGDPTPVGSTAGTAVLKAFELGAGRTGIVSEERARAAGFSPESVTITAGSRSGYYPGAADTTVTLLGDRESGRVLGGATVGEDRAPKRVDTVATALDAEMTVAELERLDLGYAPPFSPVWDPVLVAAKVLNGRLDPTVE